VRSAYTQVGAEELGKFVAVPISFSGITWGLGQLVLFVFGVGVIDMRSRIAAIDQRSAANALAEQVRTWPGLSR
jgi:hypothetical protein